MVREWGGQELGDAAAHTVVAGRESYVLGLSVLLLF